jgi:alkylation response protein AidB-like acyl-CoA dehydrogenase
MAEFKLDLTDIYFQLTRVVNASQFGIGGLQDDDMKEILNEYYKFVKNEFFPSRITTDEEGVHLVDGKVITPPSMVAPLKSYYENGWFALGSPEDIGGTEVPEALGVACISMATSVNPAVMMYPGLTKAAMSVIRLKGTDAIKKNFIQPMMEGRWNGTMCLTEAGAGSDVGALRTKAEPAGDGTYKISGTKIFISSGESDFYENSIHLVLARTPEGQPGTKGISLFVVPKTWVNEDGSLGEANDVVCTKVEEKMGIHASATCELTFGRDGNCRGFLIGDEFDGMATMFIMMNEARLLCGIQGESQSNLAFEFSKQYAEERSQFSTTINNHPDVKRMLLKMRCMGRGLRALSLYTANLFNSVKNNPEDQNLIEFLTPICKSYFTDQGYHMATEAVQIHGGYGYCKEYGVEQFIRDTLIGRIYEGTNGIQAIDFVTRKILKDEGQTLKQIGKMIQSSIEQMPEDWQEQKNEMLKVLSNGEKITMNLFTMAQKKEINKVLQFSKDTLDFWSHLVCAWTLGQSALKAHELIKTGDFNEFDREFLDSKIDDFKLFCYYYLPQCHGLNKQLSHPNWDISKLVI